jgi:heme/copper-type cytochrome/quinol oxidase subunit 2
MENMTSHLGPTFVTGTFSGCRRRHRCNAIRRPDNYYLAKYNTITIVVVVVVVIIIIITVVVVECRHSNIIADSGWRPTVPTGTPYHTSALT